MEEEGASSSPKPLSKEQAMFIRFIHRVENPLLFVSTTVIPLYVFFTTGKDALKDLYHIGNYLITGESHYETSAALTVFSAALAMGSVWLTCKYGFKPYFKAENGPLGYARNDFQDEVREQIEIGNRGVISLQKLIKKHPEAFDEFFDNYAYRTHVLSQIASEKFNEMIKEQKLFGYGENKFKDAVEDLLESGVTLETINETHVEALRKVKELNPDDFNRHLENHNRHTALLFDLSPKNFSNNTALHAAKENSEEVIDLVELGAKAAVEHLIDATAKGKEKAEKTGHKIIHAVGGIIKKPKHKIERLEHKAQKEFIKAESRKVKATIHHIHRGS